MVLLLANPAGAQAPGPPQVIPESAFRTVEMATPVPAIYDSFPMTTPGPRVDRTPPEAPVVVVPAETPHVQKVPPVRASSSITGKASWYCKAGVSVCHYQYPDGPGFDAYAAAGPKLRAALGSNWRGRVVSVNGIKVKLVDWCQCSKGLAREKVIDLYWDVAHRLGISGVGNVTIRW